MKRAFLLSAVLSGPLVGGAVWCGNNGYDSLSAALGIWGALSCLVAMCTGSVFLLEDK